MGAAVTGRIDARTVRLVAWLAPAIVAAAVLSLVAGYRYYDLGLVFRALFAFDGSEAQSIVRDLRLPRMLIAPVVGASLGVAGLLVQTLTRNRIAAPDIIGLNAGAALAVVGANLLFGIDALLGLSMAASLGAFVTGLFVFAVARAGGGMTPVRTVLVGFTIAGLMNALVQIVLTTRPTTLEQLLFWLVGSFEGRPMILLSVGAPFMLAGIAAAFLMGRTLDAMVLDDQMARSVGVPVAVMQVGVFLASAVLTGAAVAVAGPVGFVGLVVPHAARALGGASHRQQIIAAAMLGALYALLADVAARFVVYPSEAPVGAVTSFVGGLILAVVLWRRAA